MIQRIQTVYLLLTTVASGFFLDGIFLKIIENQASVIVLKVSGIYRLSGDNSFDLIQKMFPVTILSVIIPIISFIAIFLFRNRKLQINLVSLLLFLEILLLAVAVYFIYSLEHSHNITIAIGIYTFIPLITIILTILALRRIRKDENLVKSYDRLR